MRKHSDRVFPHHLISDIVEKAKLLISLFYRQTVHNEVRHIQKNSPLSSKRCWRSHRHGTRGMIGPNTATCRPERYPKMWRVNYRSIIANLSIAVYCVNRPLKLCLDKLPLSIYRVWNARLNSENTDFRHARQWKNGRPNTPTKPDSN